MAKYTHYTEQQKEQARMTDIADLLRRQGEKVKRAGSEQEWLDGSQKVSIKGNLWYHQYEQVGGDAIDFVRRFMNKSYPEAMEYLLGGSLGTLSTSPPIERRTPGHLELPKKNDTMRRVYAYLLTRRGIDKDVLNAFVKKAMVYESADYHNAVFVGYDTTGTAKHATYRGTGSESTYRGNSPNSEPEYSFHWHGESERLFLFEAPIDMLSYISMHKEGWQRHSYAACCGVGDRVMLQMLKDNPNIKDIALCLDNDDGGYKATKRIKEKLTEMGIKHEVLVPIHKDWNEDLLCPDDGEQTEEQEEIPCQELRL